MLMNTVKTACYVGNLPETEETLTGWFVPTEQLQSAQMGSTAEHWGDPILNKSLYEMC